MGFIWDWFIENTMGIQWEYDGNMMEWWEYNGMILAPPPVICFVAMEARIHLVRAFTMIYQTWWYSIALLDYQRIIIMTIGNHGKSLCLIGISLLTIQFIHYEYRNNNHNWTTKLIIKDDILDMINFDIRSNHGHGQHGQHHDQNHQTTAPSTYAER